ncbi:MAG: oligosaccharide flippase family protein, partial [Sedimenticola sp.]|nr:oligosaccharide flippase family protein [Sedimenticola sp.]
ISHSLIGIVLAYNGFGFESLAWASVGSALTTLIVGVINKPNESEFRPSFKEFKRIFSFGAFSSTSSLISEIGLNAPDLTISHNLGFSFLGYYSRAIGLVSIFNYTVSAAINPVILPTFSKYLRDNQPLKAPYLTAVSYMSVIAWTFFLFLAVMAFPITRVLYGDQWDDSIPAAQILCFAFMFQAVFSFAESAMISLGMIKLNLIIQIALQLPRLILTIIASLYSIEHVALVQVAFYIFSFITYHFCLHKRINITMLDLLNNTYKSILIAIVSNGMTLIILSYLDIENILLLVTLAIISCLSFFIMAIKATQHPVYNELSKLRS